MVADNSIFTNYGITGGVRGSPLPQLLAQTPAFSGLRLRTTGSICPQYLTIAPHRNVIAPNADIQRSAPASNQHPNWRFRRHGSLHV